MSYYFSVEDKINDDTEKAFDLVYSKIVHPEDRVIAFFNSYGGSARVASRIVEKIIPLSEPGLISFMAIGEEKIFSAAAFIFSSFNKRLAFEDSCFLIHPSVPPEGGKRDLLYQTFDFQVWKCMSLFLGKISPEELGELALQNKIISATKALEIGLVHKILEGSYKEKNKILKKEGLL